MHSIQDMQTQNMQLRRLVEELQGQVPYQILQVYFTALLQQQQGELLKQQLKDADAARKVELEALQTDLQQLVEDRRRQQGYAEAIVRQVRIACSFCCIVFIYYLRKIVAVVPC